MYFVQCVCNNKGFPPRPSGSDPIEWGGRTYSELPCFKSLYVKAFPFYSAMCEIVWLVSGKPIYHLWEIVIDFKKWWNNNPPHFKEKKNFFRRGLLLSVRMYPHFFRYPLRNLILFQILTEMVLKFYISIALNVDFFSILPNISDIFLKLCMIWWKFSIKFIFWNLKIQKEQKKNTLCLKKLEKW